MFFCDEKSCTGAVSYRYISTDKRYPHIPQLQSKLYQFRLSAASQLVKMNVLSDAKCIQPYYNTATLVTISNNFLGRNFGGQK